MTQTDLAEHIAHIETKLAYSEEAIDTLSQEVLRQQQDIKRLESRLNAMEQWLKSNSHSSDAIRRPEDEPPPPHY